MSDEITFTDDNEDIDTNEALKEAAKWANPSIYTDTITTVNNDYDEVEAQLSNSDTQGDEEDAEIPKDNAEQSPEEETESDEVQPHIFVETLPEIVPEKETIKDLSAYDFRDSQHISLPQKNNDDIDFLKNINSHDIISLTTPDHDLDGLSPYGNPHYKRADLLALLDNAGFEVIENKTTKIDNVPHIDPDNQKEGLICDYSHHYSNIR